MTPLHRARWVAVLPKRLRLLALAALSLLTACATDHGGAVPPDMIPSALALSEWSRAQQRLAVDTLRAAGVLSLTPAGYVVLAEPDSHRAVDLPAALPAALPSEAPSAAALRKRRQRERQRDIAPLSRPPVTPVTDSVTPPVTGGVTSSVTGRDTPRDMPVSSGFLPPVEGVTSFACAPACEENSPSPSFSLPTFQKKEGEGEEISPQPPASRPAVTPTLPTLTGPLAGPLASALASIPGAPRPEPPSPEAQLEADAARAAALWAEVTGHAVDELRPRDLDAIRVRCQERAPAADFRAAFAWAASEPWYAEGDRAWPRLVCGSKWAECVRKGKTRLGSSSPQSQRRPVDAAPLSQPPTPAPQPPPETVPIPAGHHPARPLHTRGATYRCLPEEGHALRLDLYLARQAQRSEAAE